MILALASLVVVGISSASSSVKANTTANLWFISWMDKDTGQPNQWYTYTFSFGDVKTATITVTNDWGDGATDSVSFTGTWDAEPPAYQGSPHTQHIYASVGIFLHTVTLTDQLGNSASKTTTITVSNPPTQSSYTGGVGGKQPVVM